MYNNYEVQQASLLPAIILAGVYLILNYLWVTKKGKGTMKKKKSHLGLYLGGAILGTWLGLCDGIKKANKMK